MKTWECTIDSYTLFEETSCAVSHTPLTYSFKVCFIAQPFICSNYLFMTSRPTCVLWWTQRATNDWGEIVFGSNSRIEIYKLLWSFFVNILRDKWWWWYFARRWMYYVTWLVGRGTQAGGGNSNVGLFIFTLYISGPHWEKMSDVCKRSFHFSRYLIIPLTSSALHSTSHALLSSCSSPVGDLSVEVRGGATDSQSK